MFALSNIEKAHMRVKTGADFPQYARDLIALGVTAYDTYVSDGHATYFGNQEPLISAKKYEALEVAHATDTEKFLEKLKLHQSGGTDYMRFCRDCAETGIEKWTLDMQKGTCTYYDVSGNLIHIERFGS